MDFIDHEFISKHLGDFFAKSSIITITITIIIDVPRTARALLAVKNWALINLRNVEGYNLPQPTVNKM